MERHGRRVAGREDIASLLELFLASLNGTGQVERWFGKIPLLELRKGKHKIGTRVLESCAKLLAQDLEGRRHGELNVHQLLVKRVPSQVGSSGATSVFPASSFALRAMKFYAECFGVKNTPGCMLSDLDPCQVLQQRARASRPGLGPKWKLSSGASEASRLKQHREAVSQASEGLTSADSSLIGAMPAPPSPTSHVPSFQDMVAGAQRMTDTWASRDAKLREKGHGSQRVGELTDACEKGRGKIRGQPCGKDKGADKRQKIAEVGKGGADSEKGQRASGLSLQGQLQPGATVVRDKPEQKEQKEETGKSKKEKKEKKEKKDKKHKKEKKGKSHKERKEKKEKKEQKGDVADDDRITLSELGARAAGGSSTASASSSSTAAASSGMPPTGPMSHVPLKRRHASQRTSRA